MRWVDLAGQTADAQSLAIDAATREAHASLNLDRGPLWTAVHFDLGAERPARLLLVVHHLAIDGVSWRPFIEDLETAYLQSSSGASIALPERTASFKSWGERLQGYAQTDAARSELPYWRSVTAAQDRARRTAGLHCIDRREH